MEKLILTLCVCDIPTLISALKTYHGICKAECTGDEEHDSYYRREIDHAERLIYQLTNHDKV